MDIMDDRKREQAQWRATMIAGAVLIVILGIEQVVPLSDALRSQIGVLTVLLGYGFWHLLCGWVEPAEEKR